MKRRTRIVLFSALLAGWGAQPALSQTLILCAGDSITKGMYVSTPYPERLANNTGCATVNEGIGGVQTARGLRNIDEWLAAYNPSHVLIMYGTNDANSKGKSMRNSADNVLQIALKVRNYGAVPVIGTIPPQIKPRSSATRSQVRSFNKYLRSYAAGEGIAVADIERAFGSGSGLFVSDGFHPNDRGAEIIARTFAAALGQAGEASIQTEGDATPVVEEPEDAYENDDTRKKARRIQNGQTQSHSIHAAGDEDWAKFTVSGHGAVGLRLETAGTSGDTEMWLYKKDGRTLIAYNDNHGEDGFAVIELESLKKGSYFVRVREYGNDGTIPTYALTASWASP